MADMQKLRELLKQRLAAMADEIMDMFQTTIMEIVDERNTPSPDPGEGEPFPPHMAQSPQQYTEVPEQCSLIKEEMLEASNREERQEEPEQTLPNSNMSVSAEETDANTPCTIKGNKTFFPWIKEEEEEVRCSPGEQVFTPEAPQLQGTNPDTPSDWTGTSQTPTDFTVKSEAPSDWTETPVAPSPLPVKSEALSDWTETPVAPSPLPVKSEALSDYIVKLEAPRGHLGAFQQNYTIEQTPDVQNELVISSSLTTLHEKRGTPPPPLLRREDLPSSSADNRNEEANSPPALQYESDATLDSSNTDMEESEDDAKYTFSKIPSKIRRKVPEGQTTQSKAVTKRPPATRPPSSGDDVSPAKRPHKRGRKSKKSQSENPKGKQKDKHKRSHFPT